MLSYYEIQIKIEIRNVLDHSHIQSCDTIMDNSPSPTIHKSALRLEQEIFEMLSQLSDIHHNNMCNLFHYNITGQSDPEIDAALIINITILDNLTARLLNIDGRILAKAKIIKDYITDI